MRWIRTLALLAGLVAVLALIVAGPGTRYGVWNFRFGLSLIGYAAFLGIAAVVLAIIALLASLRIGGGRIVAVVALALGLAAFLVPWGFLQKAKSKPPIHDVTTDTQDPPAFVAVLPLRKDALNPPTYGGASIAEQQQRAYPDIKTLELHEPPAQAFDRALSAAKAMGWTIDAAVPAAGRIEATATTAWFGFKDDVVVRIRPDSAGSRIDVRSVSRVGQGDIGTNAARVRAYLARVNSA